MVRSSGHRVLRHGAAFFSSAPPGVGTVEREGGIADIEGPRRHLHKPIAAGHDARWRRQRASGGVTEALARREGRLFADDAGATDFFQLSVGVGDPPMAMRELRRALAEICDLEW